MTATTWTLKAAETIPAGGRVYRDGDRLWPGPHGFFSRRVGVAASRVPAGTCFRAAEVSGPPHPEAVAVGPSAASGPAESPAAEER